MIDTGLATEALVPAVEAAYIVLRVDLLHDADNDIEELVYPVAVYQTERGQRPGSTLLDSRMRP